MLGVLYYVLQIKATIYHSSIGNPGTRRLHPSHLAYIAQAAERVYHQPQTRTEEIFFFLEGVGRFSPCIVYFIDFERLACCCCSLQVTHRIPQIAEGGLKSPGSWYWSISTSWTARSRRVVLFCFFFFFFLPKSLVIWASGSYISRSRVELFGVIMEYGVLFLKRFLISYMVPAWADLWQVSCRSLN